MNRNRPPKKGEEEHLIRECKNFFNWRLKKQQAKKTQMLQIVLFQVWKFKNTCQTYTCQILAPPAL